MVGMVGANFIRPFAFGRVIPIDSCFSEIEVKKKRQTDPPPCHVAMSVLLCGIAYEERQLWRRF